MFGIPQFLIGFLLSALIGILAWRAGALSRNGAMAAMLSGGVIFSLGGVSWAVLLLCFFISSSMLSRLFTQRKADLSEKFSKGTQRDWGQVLANGGLGALLAAATALNPEAIWPWVAFAGAIAAVNADTWATELGVLNPTPPRLITNGKKVDRGTSGGVSMLGSLASLCGAGLIALCALPFSGTIAFPVAAAAIFGGVSGSFFDSLLGATVQAIYYCPRCQKETERHPHHICGTETQSLRGWYWLNNDLVNFFASLFGALLAVGVFQIIT